jgi:ribonuclease E
MKMLIPSHVKRVQKYDEPMPIFQRYQVEQQMDTIHNPQVTLKSGGYLVINQTEALVAIDVNSGRSTRERNIEETALKTNLEAADELARQLRLRDLSGLIVVDFIDMDENRNQQAVERRMKDAMRNDRARIQIGSISHFGLLEMSRQRLRLSFNESITSVCPHCEGTGRVRSVETAALQMLRVVEDEAAKGKMDELRISMNRDVALYILNHKRDAISALEERFGMHIVILAGDNLIATEHEVERIGWQGKKQRKQDKPASREPKVVEEDSDEEAADAAEDGAEETAEGDDEQPKRRKRGRRGGRRRRRRGGDNAEAGADASADGENAQPANDDEPADADAAASSDGDADSDAADDAAEAKPKRRRSRGRGKSAEKVAVEADETASGEAQADANAAAEAPAEAVAEEDAEAKPKRRTRKKSAKPKPEAAVGGEAANGDVAASEDAAAAETEAKPAAKKTRKKAAKSAGTAKKKTAKKAAKAKAAPAKAAEAPADDKPAAESGSDDDKRAPISSAPQDVIEVGSAEPAKRRTGWWNRG